MFRPSPRWAVASLSLSMLMPSLDTSIANVGLPTLTRALQATFEQVQWVVLSYLLTVTLLIVFAGRVGDLVGRRRLLLAGIALFTVASLLCGLAPTIALLIAARAVQGLGAAIMMALTVALVRETVPAEKTGSAMGLLGTTSAIGTTLGPSLGGLLIGGPGWRWIFLVNVPLGILNFFMARRALPADRPASPGTRAVSVGSLLATLANSRVSRSLALSAVVSTVLMATLVVGPFYLSRGLGLEAALVGVVTSAGPLVAALTGVPAGRLVDRHGAARTTLAGLLGMLAGFVTLAALPVATGIAGYVLPLVLVTSSYALFQAANNTGVMNDVRADERGAVSGLLGLSRNLGLIAGASALGAVFAHASGTGDAATAPPDAVATGMRTTFAVAAALIGVGLAIAKGIRQRDAEQQQRNPRLMATPPSALAR